MEQGYAHLPLTPNHQTVLQVRCANLSVLPQILDGPRSPQKAELMGLCADGLLREAIPGRGKANLAVNYRTGHCVGIEGAFALGILEEPCRMCSESLPEKRRGESI